MDIIVDAEISADKKLVGYELPPETPSGRVRLVIQSVEHADAKPLPLSREQIRAKLLATGKLVTTLAAPADAESLTDTERERIGKLLGFGPVTTLDLINQDRGPKE